MIDGDTGGVSTVEKFNEAAIKICDDPNTDQPFACLDMMYIYVLLRHGFGLEDSTNIYVCIYVFFIIVEDVFDNYAIARDKYKF